MLAAPVGHRQAVSASVAGQGEGSRIDKEEKQLYAAAAKNR